MLNKTKLLNHARSLRGRWRSLSITDAEAVTHAVTIATVELFLQGNNLTEEGLRLVESLIKESENEFQGDTCIEGRTNCG